MIDIMPLLLSDTYKQTHDRMYPKGLKKLVSYWVPRKSMLTETNKMVFFGLQAFIKEYLIEYFNNNFFNKSKDDVIDNYRRYMDLQIGRENYDIAKIENLYNLGYLPLEIRALPEGTKVNMGIPCIELTNTHPDFAWLTQWVECILQVELWKICGHATIADLYKEVANKYYKETVDDEIDPSMSMADFGMRGMSCMEESVRASAAWLLLFNKTSTIPAIPYIEKYYSAKCEQNRIGIGAVSTEHSVMGANYAVDGDEITFVKRLLTELYPNTSFSMVSDTYDYWNMINNILPACRKEIMNHNGKLLVRPDSGNIVDISVETVKKLWDEFGGTTNSKGYKVLDSHIGIIYGDGCTLERVKEIWKQLKELGFAANCITFGVGAFCFSSFFEQDKLVVLTRDTFGIAMKATFGEIDDKKYFIYKDPKTDTEHLKKSYKGCCAVLSDGNGGFVCKDEFDAMVPEDQTMLKTIYKDGNLIKEETFENIRERLRDEIYV